MIPAQQAALAVIDPGAASMLAGAAITVVSGWIGWLVGRRSGRGQATRRTPSTVLICSCGHGYGTHEDEKRCHATDPVRRNGVQVLDPCPCRAYDGPEPLPRTWAPLHLPEHEPRGSGADPS